MTDSIEQAIELTPGGGYWTGMKLFIADFMKLQTEIKDPKKSGMNPFLKSKGGNGSYSNMKDILEAIRPACQKNNFIIVQMPVTKFTEGILHVSLVTQIVHSSGQSMQDIITIPSTSSTIQEFGSIVTYLRRYALLSIFGLAPDEDEDDDGEKRSSRPAPPARAAAPAPALSLVPPTPQATPAPDPGNAPDTEMDMKKLKDTWMATKSYGITDKEWKEYVGTRWRVKSSKELNPAQFDEWLHLIGKEGATKASILDPLSWGKVVEQAITIPERTAELIPVNEPAPIERPRRPRGI